MSFALYLAVALGFCQGFLGFPFIMIAPKLAGLIAQIWDIPHEYKRISTAFCTEVVLLFSVLVNTIFTKMLIISSLDQVGSGRGAAIAFFVGAMTYSILPGIEWRIKRKKRKTSTGSTLDT